MCAAPEATELTFGGGPTSTTSAATPGTATDTATDADETTREADIFPDTSGAPNEIVETLPETNSAPPATHSGLLATVCAGVMVLVSFAL